jgi:hypothetical protein
VTIAFEKFENVHRDKGILILVGVELLNKHPTGSPLEEERLICGQSVSDTPGVTSVIASLSPAADGMNFRLFNLMALLQTQSPDPSKATCNQVTPHFSILAIVITLLTYMTLLA